MREGQAPHDGTSAQGRLELEHTPEAIRRRIEAGARVSYLRDWVYGGIDGTVTTFAVVAGVAGAELSSRIILILGVANLIADGFSMAAANYIGTKAEHDDRERIRRQEEQHIALVPEGEREELRQIFRDKGFGGEVLERVVRVVTSTREQWIDAMLMLEHGMSPVERSPVLAALSTFSAFIVCGALPLVPYIFGAQAGLLTATVLSGLAFLLIGSLKSLWSTQSWWRSGIETLAIGLAAAALAFWVGFLLRGLA